MFQPLNDVWCLDILFFTLLKTSHSHRTKIGDLVNSQSCILGMVPSHDGSMVLLYMVTWIPSIYPSHVSIYTSTMDPMGMFFFSPCVVPCVVPILFVPMGWSQEVRYHDCAGSGVVHLVGTSLGRGWIMMDPMPWIPSQKQRKGTFKAINIYGII